MFDCQTKARPSLSNLLMVPSKATAKVSPSSNGTPTPNLQSSPQLLTNERIDLLYNHYGGTGSRPLFTSTMEMFSSVRSSNVVHLFEDQAWYLSIKQQVEHLDAPNPGVPLLEQPLQAGHGHRPLRPLTCHDRRPLRSQPSPDRGD